MCIAHCTMHNSQCTMHKTNCTMHTAHYIVYTAQCTMPLNTFDFPFVCLPGLLCDLSHFWRKCAIFMSQSSNGNIFALLHNNFELNTFQDIFFVFMKGPPWALHFSTLQWHLSQLQIPQRSNLLSWCRCLLQQWRRGWQEAIRLFTGHRLSKP